MAGRVKPPYDDTGKETLAERKYRESQANILYRLTLFGTNAPILTLGLDDYLSAERVATGTANISITDAGAGATATFDLVDTAVTPGSYTGADITVDQKGRITAASNGSAATSAYQQLTGTSGAASAGTTTETIAFTTTNGMVASVSDGAGTDTVTIDTPQDLQTTASPTFAGLTVGGSPVGGDNLAIAYAIALG